MNLPSLAITPRGSLRCASLPAQATDERLTPRRVRAIDAAFERGLGAGLLHLASAQLGVPLGPSLGFGRRIAADYLTRICSHPEVIQGGDRTLALDPDELTLLLEAMPPLPGAEYACQRTLETAWQRIDDAFREGLSAAGASLRDHLQALHPSWHAVGRVCFHLAEQKQNTEAPFAFLATWSEGLRDDGAARHLPLGKALAVYRDDPERLLRLLRPVHAAAQANAFIDTLTESGDVFHPLAWSAGEAHQLLGAIPDCEAAGLVVRLPDWWKGRRPPRVQATAQVGAGQPAGIGMDVLLDFKVSLALDGQTLSAAERRQLLTGSAGLRLLKGTWVEVDPERLQLAIERFQAVAARAGEDGLSFAEGMRLLAGAERTGDDPDALASSNGACAWERVQAGPWLAGLLAELQHPGGGSSSDPGRDLHGTLRPYQRDGVAWLVLLARLGLGGCLADDMGLGKTVQIISLLLLLRRGGERGPHLLVVPASLLGNWQAELSRFAPSLSVLVAHRSELPADQLTALGEATLDGVDIVITTYGTLGRLDRLRTHSWGLVAIDEAQAIKNPATRQTRAVKSLRSRMRFALTGTPVENRLGDLWSLFDFLCPGLLGTAKQFTTFAKRLGSEGGAGWTPLHDLLRPYILRRLKTDPDVAPDLPAKTELTVHCSLSKVQAALYDQAVDDLAESLEQVDGIQRRGVVLAALMRFKQICNHPSQWIGDGEYDPADSGKFVRLAELCETIVARQEKLLVFTQFRQLTAPLAKWLAGVFGRKGLVLHGQTPVKRRQQLVDTFADEAGPPFFVLSLKAGGTGLNLTAASHVVHFDRWWNPAVENQASDRAHRIGQQRNVLVHAFVCRGTIEERIDAMLADKRRMAEAVLGGGAEKALTELAADELLELVSLDVNRAVDR